MKNVVSPTPGSCLVTSSGGPQHRSSPSLVMVTNLNDVETLKSAANDDSNDCHNHSSCRPPLTHNITFDTEAADSSCTPSPRNSTRGPLHSPVKGLNPYDEDNDDGIQDRCSFFLPVAFNACMGGSGSGMRTSWGRFSLVPGPALEQGEKRPPDVVAATPETSSSYDSQDCQRDRRDSCCGDHHERNEEEQFRTPPKGIVKNRADTAPTPGTASTWTGSGSSEADARAPPLSESHPSEVSPLRSPDISGRPPRLLPSEDDDAIEADPSDLYPAPESCGSSSLRSSPPLIPQERRVAVPATNEVDGIGELLEAGRGAELRGDYEVALSSFRDALERLRGSRGGVEHDVASTLHRIGTVRWKMARYGEALVDLRASAEAYRDLCRSSGSRGKYRSEAAEVFHQMGVVHLSLGRHRDASRALRRSLRILGKEADRNPDAARTLVRLGNVSDELGRHADALSLYHRALAIQRSTLGDRDVAVAHTLDSLGLLHERTGNLGKAMGCYSEALFVYRVALGHEAADVGAALHNVGRIHHLWNELDEASGAYEEALRVTVNALGRDHRNVASILHGIGGVYLSRGRPEDAAGVWRDVLVMQRSALGDGHMDVAATLDSIAETYEVRGRYDKAARLRGKALRVRRSALGGRERGGRHVYLALSLERAGACHEGAGDSPAAVGRYQEALDVCRSASTSSSLDGNACGPLVERLTRRLEELRGRIVVPPPPPASSSSVPACPEDLARTVTPVNGKGSADKRRSRRGNRGVIVGGDFCY